MKKSFLMVALAILVCCAAVSAQNNGEANRGVKTEGAERSASAQDLERLHLAYAAAKYGRETKSADSMILAARLLKGIRTGAIAVAKKSEGGTSDTATKTSGSEMTAEAFLADARIFAGKDKALRDRIKAAEAVQPPDTRGARGAVVGPQRTRDKVLARATDTFSVTFKGSEEAIVIVSGDRDTDLDLMVYDDNGNLIASDVDSTDQCIVRFYPRRTGDFTIRIKNLGNVFNNYTLAHN